MNVDLILNEVAEMDETTFWSRQVSEHALFVSKALQAGTDELEVIGMSDLISTGLDISEMWNDLFTRLNQGEMVSTDELVDGLQTLDQYLVTVKKIASKVWIGYNFPSVIDHYLQELGHFESYVLGNEMSEEQLAAFWKDIHKDHAALFARLLDPAEENDFKQSLLFKQMFDQPLTAYMDEFPELDHFILLTEKMDDFNTFTATLREKQALGMLKSVIHPRLALHIHREGLRSILNLRP